MHEQELKTILYVEDDLYVRTTAKLVLEVLGKFEVRDCSSGGEALRAVQHFQPDLIVLDVMMPELDGMATLALLRGMPHLAATPVLFVTGLSSPADIAKYVEAGAIGIISKPLLPLRLVGQLQGLWMDRADAAPAGAACYDGGGAAPPSR